MRLFKIMWIFVLAFAPLGASLAANTVIGAKVESACIKIEGITEIADLDHLGFCRCMGRELSTIDERQLEKVEALYQMKVLKSDYQVDPSPIWTLEKDAASHCSILSKSSPKQITL